MKTKLIFRRNSFRNLKQIDLARLSNVKNHESVLKLLQTELPTCKITYELIEPFAEK